jgi:hypothetical protein
VRQALKNLPTSLDTTYKEAMHRIESQRDDDAQLGRKVLSWITYAKRPLTVAEMQHAVKVEPTTTGIEEEELISKDILVSVCAGIVTVDHESNIIRLVHYSAQEYFLQKGSVHFRDGEQEIANACLTYLLFENFKSPSSRAFASWSSCSRVWTGLCRLPPWMNLSLSSLYSIAKLFVLESCGSRWMN